MSYGKRIAALAAMVTGGFTVADIGTDHAYLPVLLAGQGKLSHAIACDIAAGPCAAARRSVSAKGLTNCIEVRQADGLSGLRIGEAESIVIAGMGGATIVGIIGADLAKARSARELILQPMNDTVTVRRTLTEWGWRIVQEELVEESGRLYELLRLVSGLTPTYSELELEIGPLLLAQRHPLLKVHLRNIKGKYERILANMARSLEAKQSAQYAHLQEKVQQLQEVYDAYMC